MREPLIYISYSTKDAEEEKVVAAYLSILKDVAGAKIWDDSQIPPGTDPITECEKHVPLATVAVLLISDDYLRAPTALRVEVEPFLERQKKEGLTVLPVLIKACRWMDFDWLRKLQIIPRGPKPIWVRKQPDENLLFEVVREIGKLLGIDEKLLDRGVENFKRDRPPAAIQPATPEAGGPTLPSGTGQGQAFDEKITFGWLLHKVPVTIWLTFLGIVGAAFTAGVTAGQIGWVKELFDKKGEQSAAAKQLPDPVKEKLDQLTNTHNEAVAKIRAAIVDEEQRAGASFSFDSRQSHLNAAENLRKELARENADFERGLAELKKLMP